MNPDTAQPTLPASPPRSATSFVIGLAALTCLLAGMAVIPDLELPLIWRTLLVGACWAIPVMVLERLFRNPLDQAGALSRTALRPVNWRRARIKWFGLASTFAIIAGIYWLLPEYRGGFYSTFWEACQWLVPLVLVIALLYIPWVDQRMSEPEDGYYHCGLWLIGSGRGADSSVLKQYALGWLVKGFFLPLMFVYMSQNINSMPDFEWTSLSRSFDNFWHVLFTIDLAIAATGYALTFRVLDAHIRSAEPTMLGWLVALVCYQPFWSLIGTWYLAYDTDGLGWGGWLEHSPVLYSLWAAIILFLITLYMLASVSFGVRFSNLTHRGIITNGLYRWSKHPAYISKNLSWWFIAIPFLHPDQPLEALRNCVLLLALNGVYYLRAKTEERHLARDPVYREYMAFMEQHALLAIVRRRCKRLLFKHA